MGDDEDPGATVEEEAMERKECGVSRQRMLELLAGSSLGAARVVGMRLSTPPDVRDKIVKSSGTVRAAR